MPAARLAIGKDGFSLPLELVTSTQAILARKRSGKSYTASVEAEELLAHKQQIAAIDPTGAWWGLRSSADGEGPGYPVVVFGGDHADAPLEPHAGRMLARALVEHGFSAIFDVGSMVVEEQLRFVADFASELLRLNRAALHLFLDEADTFAPQMVESKGHRACLGMVSRLVKQGGIRGIGVTMITQRPAAISKNVLSQVDILTLLRMNHPSDIAAATEWLKSEVSPEFARAVGEALPSLPVGTAYVCSASHELGQRIEVRERRTFNSGATPKPGERKREARVLAAVDLERLGREVADAARRTQESSPEYLRQRIAELEAGKGRNRGGAAERELAELRRELAEARAAAERVPALEADLAAAEAAQKETLAALRSLIVKLDGSSTAPASEPRPVHAEQLRRPPPSSAKPARSKAVEPGDGLTTGEQKVLDALAALEAVGVASPSKIQLAAFAGYSNAKSGGFATPTAALVRKGMMESSGGCAALTAAGRGAANKPERPASTDELQARIGSMLGEGERRLLGILIGAHPGSLTRVDLASRAGYSNAKSGGFAAPLARLIELGFAEAVGSGVVRGSEMLFLGASASELRVPGSRV